MEEPATARRGNGRKVVLKKYPNRRLYDTERNAYVTLTHEGDLIRQGRQVEVIDASTHEDVTACVLTQIVLEEAKKKNLLLPGSLLHLFIRYGETVVNEFFEKYLSRGSENLPFVGFENLPPCESLLFKFRLSKEPSLDFSLRR